jgi:cadmium resistance protein CadD (predicted permease)
MLPALGYFTILDLLIGGATILVFLAMLQSLTTSFLVSNDNTKLALHLDWVSRVLFPLVFVVFVILVLFFEQSNS